MRTRQVWPQRRVRGTSQARLGGEASPDEKSNKKAAFFVDLFHGRETSYSSRTTLFFLKGEHCETYDNPRICDTLYALTLSVHAAEFHGGVIEGGVARVGASG